jgi:hypothetical protein
MVMLASSMEIAINSLKDMVTCAVQHTPRSEALELSAKAIKGVKMNEGFSDEDLVDAALAISNNLTVANIYLHMKNKTARKLYLLHHMEKLKRDP